jgi:hypothetical protein
MLRILLTVSLCVGGALLRPDPAPPRLSQSPIKIVVPFPAGGRPTAWRASSRTGSAPCSARAS